MYELPYEINKLFLAFNLGNVQKKNSLQCKLQKANFPKSSNLIFGTKIHLYKLIFHPYIEATQQKNLVKNLKKKRREKMLTLTLELL